ncbi:MAG: hypothetical protein AVDCRST_MAG91-3323 [uncultured Sphingomonadaceae bacterium]|uniref:DUF5615 domain-containing protein n=1 Tax=uncultured Sphingomonadaceae bacterium TaxID=169976 RepID=A0A6J4U0M1_9SPHN|nr:MAG: hypothetical protein AVDCRST_MAG91-3323 [uncultured Sphingomonadaceae bacterium]
MRFLLDVHINTRLANALRELGHDVLRAALDHKAASDRQLLELAVRDQRVIVTEDSDFSDLVYAFSEPVPPAIIYIRCEPEEQLEMNVRVIDVLDSPKLLRHMVVIRRTGIRYRPFPEKSNENG